jgi:hypothetical protein
MLVVCALAAACGAAPAASMGAPAQVVNTRLDGRLPAGTVIWVEGLDPEREWRAGKVVFGEVAAPIYGSSGELLVPSGASVRARVTEERGLAVESMELGGEVVPLRGEVVELVPSEPARGDGPPVPARVAIRLARSTASLDSLRR